MKTKIDLMPASLIYKNFLAKAVAKFGITEKEARAKYGQFTVDEWSQLLSDDAVVKHTPGPWKYTLGFEDNAGPKFVVCTKTFGGEDIATIEPVSNDDGNVISEANAKLIAAAPEMLDILTELFNNASDHGETEDEETGNFYEDWQKVSDIIDRLAP